MQNVVNSFLKHMKDDKRRHLRIISVLLVLSLLVSTEVFWMLRQTGITMAGDATCGIEEHTHTDECPDICDTEEHVHSVGCYADETADVETQADWQSMFETVTLTGELGKDLAAIAKTQIGYRESEQNFEVDSLGNKNGYTRYGAWYGFPYNDWSAMFVSFCLHFAGSPTEQTPYNIGANAMATMWERLGKYTDKEGYVPGTGDLVFMHNNTVGVVYELYNDSITVIRGDDGNAVVSDTLALSDPSIKGWGLVSEGDTAQVEDPAEPTAEQPAEQFTEQYDAWAVVAEPFSAFSLRSAAQLMSGSGSGARAAKAGTMIDMTDMITAVKTEEMINGTWIQMDSGSTLTHGDRLRFTISYTVPKQTLSADNNVIFYNLPANITSVQGATGNVYNETGTVVGVFVIDAETNQIRISFNNEYAEKNENGAEIVGGLHFITTVDSIFQEGDETEGLIFNDKITVDFHVQEADSVTGDVHVEKTIAEINGNLITYTIKITSNEGTHTTVTLTDEMTGGLVFKELIGVSGVRKPDIQVSDDKTTFTAELPKISADGEYILTYTAELPEGALANTNLVNNKVNVESTNDKDDPIKDSSEVDHTFNMLNKYSHNNGDGTFSWVIEINASKLDISGWILSDTMSINGVEEAFEGTVTLTDSQGNSKQVTLPYTFPANSNDSYTVTYTTTHDVGVSGSTVIINKAKLERNPDDDETPIEDEEGIDPGVGEPLRKTGEILGEDGNGNLLIKWTVTIDTSDYAIGDGIGNNWDWYIYDKLDDDQYMTYDQLMVAIEAIRSAWASVGCGIEDYRAALYISEADYIAGGSTGNDYGEWVHSQKDPYLQDDGSLYERFRIYMDGQIPKNRTISFSYTVTAPIKPGVFEYANRINFNGDYAYEVEGEVQYNVFNPTILKAAKYYAGSEASGESIFDSNSFELDGESFDSQTQIGLDELYEDMLCWMLQVHVPLGYDGDLVITETLPQGVTLEFMQSRVRYSTPFNWVKWTNDGSGAGIFSWKRGEYTIPFEIQDNVVTITIPEKTLQYVMDNIPENIADENGHRFYFWLWTSIDEDALQWQSGADSLIKTVPFENTVTMSNGKGTAFGTATQTQVITKDLYTSSVDKFHSDTTQDNFVEYAVVLNEDGFDLDPTKDYLEIEDILSYTSSNASPIRVRLVPGSVKLYTYSDVPTELEFNYTYRETSVADTANDAVIWTNILSLVIPDSTPVRLVYRYSVTGTEGNIAKLDNTCSIVGRYHGSIDDNDHMEFILEQPSATANITSVYIYKVDTDNNGLYLAGAQFNLYMYSKTTGQYEPVLDELTGENRIFVTGEDGAFRFHFHHDQEIDATAYHLSYDTAYKLVETKAPDGYFLNAEPYEFYIKGSGTDFAIPNGYTGHVHETGDLIYYEDRKTETEISLEKIWQDQLGNVKEKTDGEIAVQLYRKTLNTEGEAYGEPVVLSAANGWKAAVTGLPACVTNPDGTAGAEYLYYVKELSVNLHTPYYQNNGGINEGKITIINRENVTYALPATGGSGTLLFVLLGIVLITIPTVYGFISRRKREGRSSY